MRPLVYASPLIHVHFDMINIHIWSGLMATELHDAFLSKGRIISKLSHQGSCACWLIPRQRQSFIKPQRKCIMPSPTKQALALAVILALIIYHPLSGAGIHTVHVFHKTIYFAPCVWIKLCNMLFAHLQLKHQTTKCKSFQKQSHYDW